MVKVIVVRGGRGCVEKRSDQMVTSDPFKQIAKPRLVLVGDLAVGATFSTDGEAEYKITGKAHTGLVTVKRLGAGRPAKNSVLPHWTVVKV